MNSLVLLIPLSILFLVGAGIALFWAIDHGQFDDMETSSLLPVVDADRTQTETSEETAAVFNADRAVAEAAAHSEAALASVRASERPR